MSWSKDIDSLRAQASKRGVPTLLIASWRIDIYFPGKWLSDYQNVQFFTLFPNDIIYQWLTWDVNVKENRKARTHFAQNWIDCFF
jgi:hypothetical protein